MRLDKVVSERFGLSRRVAREAVRRGHVDLGGLPCDQPGREVAPDTPLSYRPERPRPHVTARRLRVLYEDRHILVVNKPAGLLSQPTRDRESDTLLERASRYLTRVRGVSRPYVGLVHRIDQYTSGVMVLVCSPGALRPFQALFRDHRVERSYIAVVEGVVERASGTIDLPLVSDRGDGRRGTARSLEEGVRAITHFDRIEQFGAAATQLVCRLETGRTHQIRIHLASVGHPVIGEPVYRSRTKPPFPIEFPRQALHAKELAFVHPMTGQAIRVEDRLPDDLSELIATLRQRYGRHTLGRG
jgi:23S rRNA pseudouridine1911/1915/1917 synthase